VGKAKNALIVTLARPILFFIPLLLILPNYFGLDGVLLAGPITDTLALLLTGTWLILEVRQLTRKSLEKVEKPVVSV
jgi:Na+-driven multidrug efflux pump